MRRLWIVLGILLLLPATAFASTKTVLTHKITYYKCTSASTCTFQFEDETYQDVDSMAQLVSVDQEVRTCTAYPCIKEVETWYNWAVCYNGICPVSQPNDPVPLTAAPRETTSQ